MALWPCSFSDITHIYNMCAVRFEQQVCGRAVLNSLMQLPQSAGQGQYATEFEVPQPMEVKVEVEVEVVRLQVRVLLGGSRADPRHCRRHLRHHAQPR